MTSGMKTIIYPVADLAKAKALYGALLGVEPSVDQPYYVGYHTTGIDIGLDPNGHRKGMTGPLAYWHVADIAQSIQTLIDNGAATLQAITDVGGGKLIASLQDPDGNPIGLINPNPTLAHYPPHAWIKTDSSLTLKMTPHRPPPHK